MKSSAALKPWAAEYPDRKSVNVSVSAFIAGEDSVCESCRRGDTVNCQNPVTSGVTADGGYAELMIAEARGISSVPDELTSAEAANGGIGYDDDQNGGEQSARPCRDQGNFH